MEEVRALGCLDVGVAFQLTRKGRPYLLIAPGRLGTADPKLGIPLNWTQLSGASILVEPPDRDGDEAAEGEGDGECEGVSGVCCAYLSEYRPRVRRPSPDSAKTAKSRSSQGTSSWPGAGSSWWRGLSE